MNSTAATEEAVHFVTVADLKPGEVIRSWSDYLGKYLYETVERVVTKTYKRTRRTLPGIKTYVWTDQRGSRAWVNEPTRKVTVLDA